MRKKKNETHKSSSSASKIHNSGYEFLEAQGAWRHNTKEDD